MKTCIVVLLMMAASSLPAQLIQPISQTQTATFSNGGTASVSLDIQDAAILASGFATGGATQFTFPTGESDFSVTFALATACSYTLSGRFSGGGGDSFGGANALVNLSGPLGTVFQKGWITYLTFPLDYTTNGVLAAGTYTLMGYSKAYPPPHLGTAVYSANFTVTEVPEPATWSLLGVGVVVLFGSRKVSRRST